jgi:hypothetical protein
MNPTKRKNLRLDRHTVREISSTQLQQAQGGINTGYSPCRELPTAFCTSGETSYWVHCC